ncbi:MAG: chemotaxis protein CheA [Elusimicrobia bacterium]|nr:chemotaxis protein CheA [Candidatus Liberimonas magnetica]
MPDDMDLSQFKDMFVSEAKENLSRLNASLLELEKNFNDKDLLNEIFRVAHTLKGMSATMGYEEVAALTHEMENVLDVLRKGDVKTTENIVEILFNCFDTLELLVEKIINDDKKHYEIRPILDKLKSALEAKIEPEIKPAAPEQTKEEVPQTAPSPSGGTAVAEKEQAIKLRTESVRIKVEHLDKLMNLVGELVINKLRLTQIANQHKISELSSTVAQFDRISVDLQEQVLKTRMVPVKHIFERYPRMVRDLSKLLKKEIEFQVIGSEIEIDRTLLEEINEPLVHLLRNSVDHGIESMEERTKAGKSLSGLVKLIARREKGFCIIEVNDDGKGMDVLEIRQKAVEKEIISREHADNLTENETFMLICHPSFSTAKEVTNISGRGVGMDVVKNLVESFNGKLEIRSKKGVGSTFTMYLPLTLAIIQALLVIVSGEKYAIPLNNITEISIIDPAYIKTIENKEVLLLRDEVIPLIRLRKLFSMPDSDNIIKDSYAVIVEIRETKIGLVVDSLFRQQEIVIKTLSGILKNAKNFSGATVLGDGSVILIFDVASVM